MNKLFAYTKQYDNETGSAMHLALRTQDKLIELNNGFSILSAKCSFTEGGMDGQTKGLTLPVIVRLNDGFAVIAQRCNIINGKSEAESKDKYLLFTSKDLIHYNEEGYFLLKEIINQLGAEKEINNAITKERVAIECWDSNLASCIEVTPEETDKLITRFTLPNKFAEEKTYEFPYMPPRGDPMFLHEDSYLFMATDDEHGQNFLKIRKANTVEEIATAQDNILFEVNKSGDFSGCLWAPELHRVDGKLCIFFAAGSPHWYTVQSRVMIMEGNNPLDKKCWSEPKSIVKKDGSKLTPENTISLDMTVIHATNKNYVVWSQRKILTEPVRCGTADLFIAELDSQAPWKLASEPVLLSRPEYGWERIHSSVNEGPFAMIKNGTIYLTYSGALIDATYCLGLLTAKDGDDLLKINNWTKSNYPVLHRLSYPDQIGAGHNAFYKDEKGNEYMSLHALSMKNYIHDSSDGRRYPAIRAIRWDKNGFPHF